MLMFVTIIKLDYAKVSTVSQTYSAISKTDSTKQNVPDKRTNFLVYSVVEGKLEEMAERRVGGRM